MYLFSYGANADENYLIRLLGQGTYTIVGVAVLSGYRLKFNHFGLFGNIVEDPSSVVNGVIIRVDSREFHKIKQREFMYRMIDVTPTAAGMGRIQYKVQCKAFQSMATTDFELGPTPAYRDKLMNWHTKYGIEPPSNLNDQTFQSMKAVVNTIGAVFGLYLYLNHSRYRNIGLVLFLVDATMVLDQVFNQTRFYGRWSRDCPLLFFVLFKVFPTMLIVPYIIKTSSGLLKTLGYGALVIDTITMIQYFVEKIYPN